MSPKGNIADEEVVRCYPLLTRLGLHRDKFHDVYYSDWSVLFILSLLARTLCTVAPHDLCI